MRTPKQIHAEIRSLKTEIKARGFKITSFMNGGQPLPQMRLNEKLFALKLELEKSENQK